VLEQDLPSLIDAFERVDAAVARADGARDEWNHALDDLQKAHEVPGFFDARDNFLRSLADACARSTKG